MDRSERARLAAKARWANATAQEKSAAMRHRVAARWAKPVFTSHTVNASTIAWTITYPH